MTDSLRCKRQSRRRTSIWKSLATCRSNSKAVWRAFLHPKSTCFGLKLSGKHGDTTSASIRARLVDQRSPATRCTARKCRAFSCPGVVSSNRNSRHVFRMSEPLSALSLKVKSSFNGRPRLTLFFSTQLNLKKGSSRSRRTVKNWHKLTMNLWRWVTLAWRMRHSNCLRTLSCTKWQRWTAVSTPASNIVSNSGHLSRKRATSTVKRTMLKFHVKTMVNRAFKLSVRLAQSHRQLVIQGLELRICLSLTQLGWLRLRLRIRGSLGSPVWLRLVNNQRWTRSSLSMGTRASEGCLGNCRESMLRSSLEVLQLLNSALHKYLPLTKTTKGRTSVLKPIPKVNSYRQRNSTLSRSFKSTLLLYFIGLETLGKYPKITSKSIHSKLTYFIKLSGAPKSASAQAVPLSSALSTTTTSTCH